MPHAMEELREVLNTEIELGELLLQVLRQQQQSLVNINAGLFARSLEKEQNLLELLQPLERERIRLTAETFVPDEIGAPAGTT